MLDINQNFKTSSTNIIKADSPLKILHTSDWHLGKSLYGMSLKIEQEYFLKQIVALVYSEKIDLLIVAGDLFDTKYPPIWAKNLLLEFLKKCPRYLKVYLMSGNHDFNYMFHYIQKLNCYSFVKFIGGHEASNFIVSKNNKKYALSFYPYSNKGYDYKNFKKFSKNICVAHLDFNNTEARDSEEFIKKNEKSDLENFDLCLLGHLHLKQKIGKNCFYSGSPFPTSFNEENDKKYILIHSVSDKIYTEEKELKLYRKLVTIKGDLSTCLNLSNSKDFIRVELLDKVRNPNAFRLLREKFPLLLYIKENYPENMNTKKISYKNKKIENFFSFLGESNFEDQVNLWNSISKDDL